MDTQGYRILLGSGSPRRKELMAGLEIPFEVVKIDCQEAYPSTLQRGEIPLYIAQEKATAYQNALQNDDILITADTIVWAEPFGMLGKPKDEAQAIQMLHHLSGQTHQVYTGVCLTHLHKPSHVMFQPILDQKTFVERTSVTFRNLTDAEIQHYVTTYRPLDKAGAYGIQEWIGYMGIRKIAGSYFNVMGFPVHRIYQELPKFITRIAPLRNMP